MILLIDNYDSFVYNLYQYLGEALANIKGYDLKNKLDLYEIYNEIKVVRNDKINLDDLDNLKPDYIVLSPGPGQPKDAGICEDIIQKYSTNKIPILGVCLGHQAICESFGSEIINSKELMHGKTSEIELNNDLLFKNLESTITVARYHSLSVNEDTIPIDLEVIAKTKDNEIMAVKYKNSKIYGLQFHPESILTLDGLKIIENFLRIN